MKDGLVFLSGKISDDKNYEKKFKNAEEYLDKHGFTVLNPALPDTDLLSYRDYIDLGLTLLSKASMLIQLDECDSKGCILEEAYAKAVDIPIVKYEDIVSILAHQNCIVVNIATDGIMGNTKVIDL